MSKPNPCLPGCPDRSATCHTTCKNYLLYRAEKDAECEERLRKQVAYNFTADSFVRQVRITNRKKASQN